MEAARGRGLAGAEASYEGEGGAPAAKTAALANVLMDARTNPQFINTRGITRLTPERVRKLRHEGKTVRLVSRAKRANGSLSVRVRAQVLEERDMLSGVHGRRNLIV